jgi:hypothetical protein
VDQDDSALNLELAATFSTSFGVILEANKEDQIIVLGEVCGGDAELGFICPMTRDSSFELDYTEDDVEKTQLIMFTQSSAAVNYTEEMHRQLGDLADVKEQGSNMVVIKFRGTISSINLKVLKNCTDKDGETQDSYVYECSDPTYSSVTIPNAYSVQTDQELSKTPFQIAVGDIVLAASFSFSGTVKLYCTLLGVIEVEATMGASFGAALEVSLGVGDLLRFQDWLVALTSVTAPETEGYIDGFVTALAAIDGNFSVTVVAGPPFDFLDPISVEGEFATPYVLDFLNISGSGKPNITLDIDMPNLGDIKHLSFHDVVNILVQSTEFLVGGGPDDAVDSCSGGLLGRNIFGVNVFTYQIPGEYGMCRVCSARLVLVANGCMRRVQRPSRAHLVLYMTCFSRLHLLTSIVSSHRCSSWHQCLQHCSFLAGGCECR